MSKRSTGASTSNSLWPYDPGYRGFVKYLKDHGLEPDKDMDCIDYDPMDNPHYENYLKARKKKIGNGGSQTTSSNQLQGIVVLWSPSSAPIPQAATSVEPNPQLQEK
jgi:hypothetical protein